MKRLFILHIILLATLACLAETDWQTSFLEKYDLSYTIIHPDSIPTDGVYSWWTDSAKQNWLSYGNTPMQDYWAYRPEPLGYRGDNYRRFEIHLDSIYKSFQDEYFVHGKIRCHDTILAINGRIMIDSVVPYHDTLYGVDQGWYKITDFGRIYAHYNFGAYMCPFPVARLFGKVTYDYLIHNDSLFYDAIELVADGYYNNQYTGKWVYMDSGDTLTCNWGDFRIPQSEGLDIGAGEFGPIDEYLDNGWRSYVNGTDSTWWKESIDCEHYSDVWKDPKFPGGNEALLKWLSENVHYPSIGWTNPPEGRVLVQFLVRKDGSISEAEIVRSSGYDFLDQEVLRVILSMPNWIPGTCNGEPIGMRYVIPINYLLAELKISVL